MPHQTSLIATVVAGLVLAFLFGAVANRLRLSPVVGYLLAGVVVGPHTPGFIADQPLANQLAEIGIILLMFGVGLQFSLHVLLSVRAIAVPGAILQIAVATALGGVMNDSTRAALNSWLLDYAREEPVYRLDDSTFGRIASRRIDRVDIDSGLITLRMD